MLMELKPTVSKVHIFTPTPVVLAKMLILLNIVNSYKIA